MNFRLTHMQERVFKGILTFKLEILTTLNKQVNVKRFDK